MKNKKQTKSQMLKKYVKIIESHNFGYAFEDDHDAWLKGKNQWSEIENLQKEIDPNWIIFNSMAPIHYQVKT